MRAPEPFPSWEEQLWIALLFTCAVYRGVLPYPVVWLDGA
jgi:hypothetical protein